MNNLGIRPREMAVVRNLAHGEEEEIQPPANLRVRIVEFALTVLGELYKGLRRAGYIICCIVATPIVIVLAALFITPDFRTLI